MGTVTEGKHLGHRKAWGKGTQSIALAHHAIRGQTPPDFTRPTEDHAFKAMQEAYNTRLQGMLDGFRTGGLTRGQFESQAKTAIRETFAKAYQLGAHRMGGGADHALDPQDERWLKGARYHEFEFLNKFADALQNATFHVDPVQRMEMYADTLESMFWAGQISATADNATIHWNLSPSEHCQGCLELAANSPYTRKTLPAVPRASSTPCLVGCMCFLSVTYDAPPAIDDVTLKRWTPMKEWDDAAPPPGMRGPTEEEKGFIDNLGLRIRFEADLARSAGQEPGNRHTAIAAGVAAALAAFLAARKIWAPPTWAVDDGMLATGEEFERAFEQDRITLGELEAMSEEEFARFLEEFEARFPSDVPRTVKRVVDTAVQQAGYRHEDKAREAMRILLEFNANHEAKAGEPLVEFNPFHDRIGRFTSQQYMAPATDGGGAYGGTATLSSGSGRRGGNEFVYGHEEDVALPEAKPISVVYSPKTGHVGWMEQMRVHNFLLEAMRVRPGEDREQYVHVNVIGDRGGPYRKALGLTVTSAGATVGDRLREARAVNQTMAMLRRKGFPAETPVDWYQWNGTKRRVTLGDTVQVEQKALVGTIAGEILQEWRQNDAGRVLSNENTESRI